MRMPLAVLVFSTFFTISLSTLSMATFYINSGTSCNGGDFCVFSLWNLSNSHVGRCGYYTNYTVCTDELTSVSVKSACASNEGKMLNFYQENNTHIELANGSYTNKLCSIPKKACVLRTSCLGGESPVISMFDNTNSHAANKSHYPKVLCCFDDNSAPVITNETAAPTSVDPGSPFSITANITDNGLVDTVTATIRYPNSTSTNVTMSRLVGDLYFSDFTDTNQVIEDQNYVWTDTYATDTVGNTAHTTPNISVIVRFCYVIEGSPLDYFTGLSIDSGTVTAIVKETGEKTSISFTGGSYSFCLFTKVNLKRLSATVGVIINTTDSKVGWNSIVVGGGPLAEQTQQCSVRQLRFAGKAITTSGAIGQGAVSVRVDTEAGFSTNSTSFTNGSWEIRVSPCLMSGGLYTFNFAISGEGRTSFLNIRQVAG